MTGETKPVHQLGGSTLSIRGCAPTQLNDKTATKATTANKCRTTRRECGVVTVDPQTSLALRGIGSVPSSDGIASTESGQTELRDTKMSRSIGFGSWAAGGVQCRMISTTVRDT